MENENNIYKNELLPLCIDGIAMDVLPLKTKYETHVVYDIPVGKSTIDKSIIEFEVNMAGKQLYGANPRNILTKMTYRLYAGFDPESLETIGRAEVPLKNMDDASLFEVDFGDTCLKEKRYGPEDLFERSLFIESEKIGTLKIDMNPDSMGAVSFRLPTEQSYVLLPKKNGTSNITHQYLFGSPDETEEIIHGEIIIKEEKRVPNL